MRKNTIQRFGVRLGDSGPAVLTVTLPRRGLKVFRRGVTDRDDREYPYDEFEGTEREAREVRAFGMVVETIGKSALKPSPLASAPQTPGRARPRRRTKRGD